VGEFRLLGTRTIARTAFLRLDTLHFLAPDGAPLVRAVVRHPGAVAVVPIAGTDVILIEQFRAPLDRPLLEIPAGKLDVIGEDPELAAMRELEEEIGRTADHLELLTEVFTAPGFTDERIIIYLATDLREVPSHPVGAEEKHAEIHTMSLEAAVDLVAEGTICDAKSVAGILLAAHRR
jgi:8-oxo-dGTP pyrophosphatase MutT (NUDIX family)